MFRPFVILFNFQDLRPNATAGTVYLGVIWNVTLKSLDLSGSVGSHVEWEPKSGVSLDR